MTIIDLIKEILNPKILIPFIIITLFIIYIGQTTGFIIGIGYSRLISTYFLDKWDEYNNKEDK